MLNIEAYKSNPKEKGSALIIVSSLSLESDVTNEIKKDTEKLEKFWKSLGYKVTVKKNLDEEGFKSAMKDFSNLSDHNRADSCVVHVVGPTTHDQNNWDAQLQLVNSRTVSAHKLVRLLKPKMLRNKPKIFFLTMYTCDQKLWIEDEIIVPSVAEYLNYVDVFIVTTFQPDCVSGSGVVQTLIDSFKSRGSDDFITILEHMRRTLRTGPLSNCDMKWEVYGVSKHVYFKPNLMGLDLQDK